MLNKLCLYSLRNMNDEGLIAYRQEKESLFIGPTNQLQWKEWVAVKRTKLLRF